MGTKDQKASRKISSFQPPAWMTSTLANVKQENEQAPNQILGS